MDDRVYQDMLKIQEKHWWFAGRRALIEAIVKSVSGSRKNLEILEVGAGVGGNYELLSRFGSVELAEPHDRSRERLEHMFGKPAFQLLLPDTSEIEGRRFDLIGMFDVLEHVEYDRDALAALLRHLKPNGRIIVTVPAYMMIWSEHDVEHHHFRRYTRRHLEDVVQRSGGRIDRIGYFNTLLFPAIAALRLASKCLPGSSSKQDRMPAYAVNYILRHIFEREAAISSRLSLPFGVSLYCTISAK